MIKRSSPTSPVSWAPSRFDTGLSRKINQNFPLPSKAWAEPGVGGKVCQKHSWHKGAPAAFCHLLSWKQIKHKIEGSSSLPSKSLFISQERKKKIIFKQLQFSATAAQLGSQRLHSSYDFFFSFREKNHLEASLHLAPKETILKKLSRCSMLFFLNKRTPLEWEMRIAQQILNILPPLSPLPWCQHKYNTHGEISFSILDLWGGLWMNYSLKKA